MMKMVKRHNRIKLIFLPVLVLLLWTPFSGHAEELKPIPPLQDRVATDQAPIVATGSSVYYPTGTYYFAETDLRVAARSIPMVWDRAYRSNRVVRNNTSWIFAEPTDGPMGFGWMNVWLSRIEGDTYVNGEGRYFPFQKDANGNYLPNQEAKYVLKKTPTGYELLELAGNAYIFNASGKLTSIKDSSGNTAALTYDPDGKLMSIQDIMGRTIFTFSHTPAGRIATVTDIANRTITYGYDSFGNLATVTQGTQVAARYTYNGNHGLTAKSNALNETYTIEYHPSWLDKGIVKRVIDPAGTELIKAGQQPVGHEMTFTYEFSGHVYYYTDYRGVKYKSVLSDKGKILTLDEIQNNQTVPRIKNEYLTNRIIKTTDAIGNASTVQKDEWGNITKRIDPAGYEWKYTFDAQSRPLTITDPLGTVTKYEYDQYGNRTKFTQAAGTSDESVTTYGYNQYNELTSTTIGSTTITYTSDSAGNRTEIKDPLGNSMTITYDEAGNRLSITKPLVGATSYSNYDYNGNPGSITDPNGTVTLYTYDSLGRVKTVTNQADNSVTQYFYVTASGTCTSCGGGNGMGKIDHITLPEGNKIGYEYGSAGNMTKITDNDGNSINYTYDNRGNKIKEEIRDANGILQKSLSYEYDLIDKLKKVINPDNTFTEYSYDSRGNEASNKNPRGYVTAYLYNAANRRIKIIQPGNITTSYTYNRRNDLINVTDANNNTTFYEYNSQKQLTKSISPDTGTTTYSYDPAGNLISKTDAKGVTISYQYDALNRLTKIDFPTDTDVIYTYDNCINGKGWICTMTDASGTTTYEYTAKGEVKKETKVIDAIQYVTQYTHDKNGNLKSIMYPSGRVITYNYSNDKVVSVLNNAANLATGITYKPYGGISSLIYGNGLAGSIGYDNQYRVTRITAGAVMNLSYPSYDANGNITVINNTLDATKNKSFSYDGLDRLTSATASGIWGSLAWTYDGVGNRLTENGNGYSYIPNTNKLTTAPSSSFTYDPNGNTASELSTLNSELLTFTYNQNQRLNQVVDGAITAGYTYNGSGQRAKKIVNGVTTVFHYDRRGKLMAESDSNTGTITAEYVYLNNHPLAKIEGSNIYFYLNDHLDTPQKMTDSAGSVVWEADYKPFGEVTITASTVTNNLRFPGQYFDAETGLYYNYYRDYNPVIGRYAESDPLGISQGENPIYVYAKNNPLSATDPFGLWTSRIHEKLTRDALNRVNCSKAADAIAAANVAVDKDQSPEDAWKHAMTNGCKPEDKWFDIFKWDVTVTKGKSSCDVGVLGLATHALQDAFAPAHRGFQPWCNRWWEYPKHISDDFESAYSAMAEIATEILLSGIAERCPCLCK